MIIIIAGGIGSGKTITAVKHAVREARRNIIYTNFKMKHIKEYHRLRWDDIMRKEDAEDPKKAKMTVYWEFWKDKHCCDIVTR